jgi:G3E family GTPase
MKRTSKIDVTVITGFLGAGKTTFINSLLKQNQEIQFALVENEFGEISIDSKLIKGVDASQMFELKQGCICCTITDEFELVLQELAERFPNVEHLLIETTGIADPAPVIRPFFTNEDLKEAFQYNGSICLIDALNFENSPEKALTTKQLIVADLVLISKADKLSAIQKSEFKTNLQRINPFAEIEFTQLKTDGFKAPFRKLGVDSLLKKKKSAFDFVGTPVSHLNISSKTLCFNQVLNKADFLHWFSYTIDIYKNQIYRTKGILCFENELYEYILQGVGGSFELTEGDMILDEVQSELVFIGKLDGVDLTFLAL